MADPNEIAKAKVTIEGDISGLKESVQDAKKAVKDVGDEADKTSVKGEGMFRKLGSGADGLASKLGKMTGIVSAITAAAVALGAAIKAVNDYLRDGEKVAGDFLKQFDSVKSAETALDAVNARLVEVGAELERLEAKPFSILGRSKKQILEELEALREAQLRISRQVRAQREQDAREAAESFKNEALRVADEIETAFLPDDLRIQRQAGKYREEFIKAAREAGVAIGSEEVQRALRSIDARTQIEIEIARKVDEEKRRLEQDEKRRRIEIAKAEADAYVEQLRQGLESITSGEFTTVLQSIPKILQEVSSRLGRLK